MQFVWFVGDSAVGKQKTIRRCLDDPDWAAKTFQIDISHGLREFWTGELPHIDYCGGSLMKWQRATDDHIQAMQLQRPYDEHIVIFLRRETEEHFRGYLDKYQALYHEDGDWNWAVEDLANVRSSFEIFRNSNHEAARVHRGSVDRFMEFYIENDVFTLVTENEPVAVSESEVQMPLRESEISSN